MTPAETSVGALAVIVVGLFALDFAAGAIRWFKARRQRNGR